MFGTKLRLVEVVECRIAGLVGTRCIVGVVLAPAGDSTKAFGSFSTCHVRCLRVVLWPVAASACIVRFAGCIAAAIGSAGCIVGCFVVGCIVATIAAGIAIGAG